ncbi:MAG: alpha/beta hydrolase, partial [Gillisia sp.]
AETSVADASRAVAWVFNNIQKFNGDPNEIFVSGHSAGGYLALMTVIDKDWLAKYDIDANSVAGLIPFSGHTITHFTIRKERGIPGEQPIIDKWAPLYYVRGDAPPTLLITGDREKEMLGRYEENAYFYRMMKVNGQKDIKIYEMDGYGHNMTAAGFPLLLNFVKERTKN